MKNKQSGQILIIAVVFLFVMLVLGGALFSFIGQNVNATRREFAKEQALQLAEAGIERAVWQLNETAGGYGGESGTSLVSGAFDVEVSSLGGSRKLIKSIGYVPSKTDPIAQRELRVEVTIDTQIVSFNYGVQVGLGGLVMQNNSSVDGNVYSNGVIDGAPGAIITGDAISAEAAGRIFDYIQIDGSARAHQIDTNVIIGTDAFGYTMNDLDVTGNVYTNTISNCTVGGDLHYTTENSCTVTGSLVPGYPGEIDPPAQDFPITDQQITDWKTGAESGGTIVGDYILDNFDTGTLGPKKITGDLILDNGAKLTLTGPLWVVGEVHILNNAIIALDPTYGDTSETIVSDGIIDVVNNAIFQKAGTDSFILMLTTSTADPAFTVANNADALIAYAPFGAAVVANNAILREVSSYKLRLNNNSQVIYETGLASVEFNSGPGASWRYVQGTWREVK